MQLTIHTAVRNVSQQFLLWHADTLFKLNKHIKHLQEVQRIRARLLIHHPIGKSIGPAQCNSTFIIDSLV